ncbi:MAG: hypothetical protein ACPLW5_07010, partial [Candidatus Bathyarchaeales archaeon]
VKGEIKHQRIDGRMVKITLPQRNRWLLIAAQTAKIIESITANIDEKEIKTKLQELEKSLEDIGQH